MGNFRPFQTAILMTVFLSVFSGCGRPGHDIEEPLVFTTFVEFPDELARLSVMVESLRTFGGRYRAAPFWAYIADEILAADPEALDAAQALGADIRTISIPDDAAWYFLSRKVFAAAHAEKEAAGGAGILARLDPDTIFIDEPAEFVLPAGKVLGWRTVFHRNISPLFNESLDEYWARAYEVMGINEASVFPMITPADNDRIRPYFQAGCVVVRPERGIMKKWEEMLISLARDPSIKEICRGDRLKRTFTFQVALIGAILNSVDRSEMHPFSDRINYPIFFKEMFGGKKDFHDITDMVTIRYEYFLQNTPPDWDRKLEGPADKIAWVKERFTKKD